MEAAAKSTRWLMEVPGGSWRPLRKMSPHSTTDRHIAWTQRGLTKIVTDSRLGSRQRLHLSSDHDGPAPHENVRTVAGVTKIVTFGHRKSSHCRRLLQDDRNVSSVLPRPATHTRHSTHVAGDVLRTPPCPRTRRSRHSVRRPHFSHACCSQHHHWSSPEAACHPRKPHH